MFKGPITRPALAQPSKNETPTPHSLAQWIHATLSQVITPRVILDPCAGLDNRLTHPWRMAEPRLTVHSYEIRNGTDFFDAPAHPDVDLAILNPPFAWNGPTRAYAPEEFLKP